MKTRRTAEMITRTFILVVLIFVQSTVFAIDNDDDGIDDRQDNCIEIPNPDQRDTNGDGFGNLCDADLDNNGTVSFADLNLFKSKFGTADQDADFDGNGSVSFADLNIFTSLFGFPPGPAAISERIIDNGLPNLLAETNPVFNSLSGYENAVKHAYIADDSHQNDGSGCVEIVTHHWSHALTSSGFYVEKGKKYLLSGYMKVSHFPHGQNLVIGITPRSIAGRNELYWNASKENTWEEVLLPFIPLENGIVKWRAFTTTNSFSTDSHVARVIHGTDVYKPSPVEVTGSNLDRSSRVFLDDFKVIEILEEITPREPVVTEKKTFNSDYIRVDKLGNFSVNKEGIWTPIIPKLISRGKSTPINHFRTQLNAYRTHGFNGVISMYDVNQVIEAFSAGLEFFVGMGAESNTLPDGTQGEYSSIVTGEKQRFIEINNFIKAQGKPYSRLFHYLDNENEKLQEYSFKQEWANFIDQYDQDGNGKRARPIFYLNGQFGMSRLYGNGLMDITGSYVGMGGVGNPDVGAPKATLSIMDVTHNHPFPAPIIQLQVYLGDKFIPSLWFGIIQGGKAVAVWRDGEGNGNDPINNPVPFQQQVWSSEIARVFDELDSLAPMIREPHWTYWKAHFEGSEYVNLGTRDHKGDSYVIISNHSDNDETITISFDGITPSEVTDIFGNSGNIHVTNGKVKLSIGHGNEGYLVLKLTK